MSASHVNWWWNGRRKGIIPSVIKHRKPGAQIFNFAVPVTVPVLNFHGARCRCFSGAQISRCPVPVLLRCPKNHGAHRKTVTVPGTESALINRFKKYKNNNITLTVKELYLTTLLYYVCLFVSWTPAGSPATCARTDRRSRAPTQWTGPAATLSTASSGAPGSALSRSVSQSWSVVSCGVETLSLADYARVFILLSVLC